MAVAGSNILPPTGASREGVEMGNESGERELIAQSRQRSFYAGSIRPFTTWTDNSIWTAPSNQS